MAFIPPSNGGSSTPASSTGNSTNPATSLIPNIKTFFFYGISALALIALADFLPKAAVSLTVVLAVGVLLAHASQLVPYITGKF